MKGYIRIDKVENGYVVTDFLNCCPHKRYIGDDRWHALQIVAQLLGFGVPIDAAARVGVNVCGDRVEHD